MSWLMVSINRCLVKEKEKLHFSWLLLTGAISYYHGALAALEPQMTNSTVPWPQLVWHGRLAHFGYIHGIKVILRKDIHCTWTENFVRYCPSLIYVCVYSYMYMHLRTWMNTNKHVCLHMHICIHRYTNMFIYIYEYIWECINKHIHARKCMQTCINVCIHLHIHVDIHCTYTYMYIR